MVGYQPESGTDVSTASQDLAEGIMSPSGFRERLLLVGGIPWPIGGVTQHVWRLAMRIPNCRVLDIRPHDVKYPTNDFALSVAPRPRLLRAVWLGYRIRRSPALAVHFHISVTGTLAGLGRHLVSVSRGKRTILTCHHGDQRKFFRLYSRQAQRAIRETLHRIDAIVCGTEMQREFFRDELGISEAKLIRANNYVALDEAVIGTVEPMRDGSSIRREGDVFLIASGSCQPHYRHEWAIRVTDRLRSEYDAHLGLCLYATGGFGSRMYPDYEGEIERLCDDRPYVHVFRNLDFPEFVRLQRESDLYLRPAAVDSCGLAVADSIALGVGVVASDVCERPPQAAVFRTDEYEGFEACVVQHIQQPRRPDSLGHALADYDAFHQIVAAYVDPESP